MTHGPASFGSFASDRLFANFATVTALWFEFRAFDFGIAPRFWPFAFKAHNLTTCQLAAFRGKLLNRLIPRLPYNPAAAVDIIKDKLS